MLKSELVECLAKRFGDLAVHDIHDHVSVIIEALCETLSNNGRIEIRGFGSFALRYRPPRKARNPKTGKRLTTTGRYRPHFKPGKDLREQVNAGE